MDRESEFREFVVARSGSLLGTAYLLTGDTASAEDLLQTTLVKAWSAWRRVRDAERPETYVRRILVNAYAASRRRRWTGERPTADPPDRPGSDPTLVVDAREEMWQALRSLPRRQRAIVVLRYYEDLTETETARTLGISVGTVKSQTARAIARLRADDNLVPNGGAR